MDFNDFHQLHFAYPFCLLGFIVIPLVWILFFLFHRAEFSNHHLEKFIDRHLLPYLLVNEKNKQHSFWKHLLLWSFVWSSLILALAGPRWDFREIETFSRDQSLVILLDLSESMNATDIKPSRLARAKQKIEDLITSVKGVKIGLVAFAADPHMIAPLTEDIETIRQILPSLNTDLVYVQGSRLSSAFEMAAGMLMAERGDNKALLVISDGGFEDASAIVAAKRLAEKGIVIHVMGVGSNEGVPLRGRQGDVIKKGETVIVSKLEKERLNELSKIGNGHYLEANHADQQEIIILKELEKRAETQMEIGKKNRFWDERFYLLIFPILPIVLWWFRRGSVLAAFFIFFIPAFELEAATFQEYFKNSEELGKQAIDSGDYETAINKFQDPYRKGVALYKAGNFIEAEKMFRLSNREDVVSSAAYNLGNTLVQQQKYNEAVDVYEDLLKKRPDHVHAKENLELVKTMLDQQKQEDEKFKDQSKEKKSDQKEETDSNSEQSDQQKDQQKDEKSKEQSKDKKSDQKKDADSNSEQSEESTNENEQRSKEEERKKNEKNKEETSQKQNSNEVNKDPQNLNQEKENQKEEKVDTKSESEKPDEQEEKGSFANARSQEDQDADFWLNRIKNDQKTFLKNKFYLESMKYETMKGSDPW